MKRGQLQKFKLPDEPGVYIFKKGPKILYIGKATSLRDRVRSYFSADLVKGRGGCPGVRGVVGAPHKARHPCIEDAPPRRV